MIRHEAFGFWIIEKPAGLLSQKDSGGDDSLVQELKRLTGADYIGLVHRLDRNTSGLMVVAKDPKSADLLTRQLQSGVLVRRYQALLAGQTESDFAWTHHLEKNADKNHVTVFRRPSPKSKEARLRGKTTQQFKIRGEDVSLVEFELDTGRSHQIRSQAAFEKHPIIGDHRYGKKLPVVLQDFSRPALHSSYLSLRNPKTNEVESYESPLDVAFFCATKGS